MKNLLAVALIVAVASIALSQAPAPKPAVEAGEVAKAAPWEYHVLYIPTADQSGLDANQRGEHLAQHLNTVFRQMAEQGWELFLIPRDTQYVFRKPVEQPRALPGRGNIEGRLIEKK